MKLLSLSTFDIDGGASRAAFRLNNGLRSLGVSIKMLVNKKLSYDQMVIGPQTKFNKGKNLLLTQLDRIPLLAYRRYKGTTWSLGWLPNNITSQVSLLNPDLIHIHWVGFGFLPISALLKFNKPLVWTFHDMWAFTGGCHYTDDCIRYRNLCGCCPQLESSHDNDLSRYVMSKKLKMWQQLKMTIITPSRWLADCSLSSRLFSQFHTEVIPNGLDIDIYKPIDKSLARRIWGIPVDTKIVAFSAINAREEPRKGFKLLSESLNYLASNYSEKILLLIIGTGEPEVSDEFPYPTRYLGRLYDDVSMALAYSAADVMVVPSIQEAFGQTASEAMACGTPVVAFAMTGPLDIVNHKNNGYLAKPQDSVDLAAGISWVLSDSSRYSSLATNARKKAESEFSLEVVAKKHHSLYREILSQ